MSEIKIKKSTSLVKFSSTLILLSAVLAFLAAEEGSAAIQTRITLESYRITQGLEVQGLTAALNYYDLVVGKDTLLRAIINSPGERINAVRCNMLTAGSTRSYTARLLPLFDDQYVASCWIPGADINSPGTRAFAVVAEAGSGTRRFPLNFVGSDFPVLTTFRSTRDLRLMVVPWILPPSHPAYLPWSDAFALNVVESINELNRRFPVRTGVGDFNFRGTGTGGVRYHMTLPSACEIRDGETLRQAEDRCGAQHRSTSDFMMRLYNGFTARSRPGYDLFDIAWTSLARTTVEGGQDCRGNQRSFFGDLGPNPVGSSSATVLTHELGHCMGEVTPTSPNWNTRNHHHATVWEIVTVPNITLVNMRTRQVQPTPVSLMGPVVANVFNTYLESHEWNSIREKLVRRTGLLASLNNENSMLLASNGDMPDFIFQQSQEENMFGLLATLSRKGEFAVQYSGRLGVLDKTVATADEQSEYRIVFYDKAKKILRQHGFMPIFETPDGKTDVTGISVATPMPADTASISVERNNQVLHAVTCDNVAPVVSTPNIKSNNRNLLLQLRWEATHSNARELRYNVSFAANRKQEPLLLAAGLSLNEWQASRLFLPATKEGAFFITASDGCNVSTVKTVPVSIAHRAPLARLQVNQPDASNCKEFITVSGVAWDYTDGVLEGASLQWYINNRRAGTGDILVLRPEEVGGRVKLVAKNAAGMQTSVEETVRSKCVEKNQQ